MKLGERILGAAVVGILAGCAKQPEVAPVTKAPTSNVAPTPSSAPTESENVVETKPTMGTPTPIEQHPTPMGGPAHACMGQNECKGKGGCKTPKNACKGLNDCKGQGGCKA